MDRRVYLACVGVLLTGCSDTPENGTASPTDSPTSTETPRPTQTDTETPTETDTATEEPTSTPTPEPSEVELELRAAIQDLDAALEEYPAPNMTFLETNATRGEFSQSAVRSHLRKAKTHLRTAEEEMSDETPEELRDRHEQLFGVYWFFYWAGPVQTELKEVIGDLAEVRNASYAADTFQASTARDHANDHLDTIDENLEKLKRDSDPEDATAPCELTEEQYRDKLAQFEGEREDLDRLLDLFQDVRGVLSNVADGLADYGNGNYTDASAAFYDAGSTFNDYAEDLDTGDFQPAFSNFISQLVCISGAMAEGCSLLDTAATAGSNGNSAKRESAEEDAREAFEQCDAVFEVVTPLADFYGVDDDQESLIRVFDHATKPLFSS